MKRFFTLCLCTIFCFSFTACTEKARLQQELKEAQETASIADRIAEETQDNYDRLTDLFNEYDKLTEQLENLPEGSEEYQAIVSLRNALVRMMIDEYPDLAQYVTEK